MKRPVLSILIPSIPSRSDSFKRIFAKLESQEKGRPIEILSFIDNKKRSIGLKRDALVRISLGDYVSFVDDDDNVSDDYIVKLLQAAKHNPDVITFKQKCTIEGMECIVDFDLNHKDNEPFGNGKTIKRRPWHVCAFRGDIARKHRFPDSSYGEDWEWCKKVLQDVKTQVKINDVIHSYIFDKKISEAANG